MTIKVTTDVFCNVCGNWVHGLVDFDKQAQMARDIARDQGWITQRRDGKLVDLCPNCQETLKDAKSELSDPES